ncbi:MAG TPA: MFS transporter, partial [Anaerolineae bacterium]|nr:MFS transporter [Anaerolineae bacterium]
MQSQAENLPTTIPINQGAFSVLRSLRLSTFQIGSAMGEILTASVWNRVMISDLGMPATPVGLLLALQYILLPIGLWIGHRSDTVRLLGRRRDSYIWLGRGLMLLAFPLLGQSVAYFESAETTLGWLLATVAFLLFGSGKLASGSVFLALVRESAPAEKQGLAIGLTETALITLFPIVAISFGRWMEHYEEALFWQLIVATIVIGGFFWWLAIFRVEDRVAEIETSRSNTLAFRQTLSQIWSNAPTRAFFIFLSTATFAAWMQDNILEPFGGDVFSLPAGITTRFTGYWGGTTVLFALACFGLLRERLPQDQGRLTSSGLIVMAISMVLLAVTSFTNSSTLLTPSLLLFGAGFGVYTFGGLSLMAVMSPSKHAGAYLGLWTASILLSKGAG